MRLVVATLSAVLLAPAAALASSPVTAVVDVNPDMSDTDASDPDGASGGRVNGLAIDPTDSDILYAASEWGGLYKSIDRGVIWSRLDAHLPVATWDVEVDPGNPVRVYATSLYDGRVATLAGINVSTDGGSNWARPSSSAPPAGFCLDDDDRSEPSAFGIAIDPLTPANVFIGTSCGLAASTDAGLTWTYRDPTPADGADRVWDVVAQGGGLVDVCGDDGHLRSTDGGVTWQGSRLGAELPSGRCSLAASPDEAYVLIATVGTSIYETTNAADPAGAAWSETRSNPAPQGRIPFVETNQRSDAGNSDQFDLWFGDVKLHRVGCTTPTPKAAGGSPRCGVGQSPPWAGPYTRTAGAHDDCGGIVFDSEVAIDACPVAMSSDGGVYRNTLTASPTCHAPAFEQPDVSPHALWLWAMAGADVAGDIGEDLYFGNQDNGVFGTGDAGAAAPNWHNEICCDGFDAAAEPGRVLYSICCFGGGRATRFFLKGAGFIGGGELTDPDDYPPGGLPPGFRYPDVFASYGDKKYVTITRNCRVGIAGCPGADGGVFVTDDITASPVGWRELGDATEPPSGSVCGIRVGVSRDGVPTFYAQTGDCNSRSTFDRMYRFTGTAATDSWTRIRLPTGGFGVFAVNPTDPLKLLASGLTSTGAAMYRSADGGETWSPIPALDTLMTAGGAIKMRNRRGPSFFSSLDGYWQPSLVAFDPTDQSLQVAGGKDSGVFVSTDGGDSWELATDPTDPVGSGVPHLPRPWFAYFDAEPGSAKNIYIGTQGRGVWRLTLDEGVLPRVSIDDVTVIEGDAGTVLATFLVSLNKPGTGVVTVDYATADGTATAPTDYAPATGRLSFAVGETAKPVSVTVNGDVDPESDETFHVILTNPQQAAVSDAQGLGTIGNDDPLSLSIGDVARAEGDAGTTALDFTVTLSPSIGTPVTVDFQTADGTAHAGGAAVSDRASIGIPATGPDPTTADRYPATLEVPPLTGTVTDVDVTLFGFSHRWPQDVDVLLVGPAGDAVVLQSDVGGTTEITPPVDITFDDEAADSLPGAIFSSGSYRPTDLADDDGGDNYPAPAPAGPFATSLSVFDSSDPQGVWSLYVVDDVGFADGGSYGGGWSLAIQTDGGDDYIATAGRLTFGPGEASKTVSVAVLGDVSIEPDENLSVSLSDATGADIVDGTGVGTIVDDDAPSPTVTLDELYDGVGVGAGRTIEADSGAVEIVAGGAGGAGPSTLLRLGSGNSGGRTVDVNGGSLLVERRGGQPAAIVFRATGAVEQSWRFQNNGVFAIRDQTSGQSPVRVFAGGAPSTLVVRDGKVGIGTADPRAALDVDGPIYQRGVPLHADHVFARGRALLPPIEEHALRMWSERRLPAVPGRAVDTLGREVVDVASHRRGMLEELEAAHIYIEELDRRVAAATGPIAELEARLAAAWPTARTSGRDPRLPLIRVATLDAAYDAGAPGGGRTITADAGAVEILSAQDTALTIDNGDSGGNALEIAGGELVVERADGGVANIRFEVAGGVPPAQSWVFQNNPSTGVFAIRDATAGVSTVQVFQGSPGSTLVVRDGRVGIGTESPEGTLDVDGTIVQRGIALHADYVFDSDYPLETIAEHAAFMWGQGHLEAVPPRRVDSRGREVIAVGAHRRGMLEELEKAHIYIVELDGRATSQAAEAARLSASLERHLWRLAASSRAVDGDAPVRLASTTLDDGYDADADGAGRTIHADAGPVVIRGGSGTLLRVDSADAGGTLAEVSGGSLVVGRSDGGVANIRFRSTGGAADQEWTFQNNAATGVFAVRDASNGASVVRIFARGEASTLVVRGGRVGVGTASPTATLDVTGEIYQRGSSLHADHVFEPGFTVPTIADHAAAMWREGHLSAVPPYGVDSEGLEVLEAGAHRRGMLEELELAHIFIARLDARLERQSARLARLRVVERSLARRVEQQQRRSAPRL